MPCIMQCFIKKPEGLSKGIEFDRKLYIVRRVFSHSNGGTYTVSLSLSKNHISHIEVPREMIRARDWESVEMMYDDVADILSQCIHTTGQHFT